MYRRQSGKRTLHRKDFIITLVHDELSGVYIESFSESNKRGVATEQINYIGRHTNRQRMNFE
jgi:hypothetical protein